MDMIKKVEGVFHDSKSITSRKLQSSLQYIIIGNDQNQENQVLMNDGTGTFTTAFDLPGGALNTFSVATADLNGDGKADIIIGNYNQGNQVLMNDGTGTFTTASTLPGGALSTYSIAGLAVGPVNPPETDVVSLAFVASRMMIHTQYICI